MLIECACCKKETEHQHLHNCAHGIPDLEKTHYETTYDRVQRLESQLAEARAENSHLWVRIESGEAAAYEQGKAEARQAAAREIIEQLDKQQPYHENATYLFIRDYIVKTFGLEG